MVNPKKLITLGEIEQKPNILPFVDSISQLLTPEEITTYSHLVDEFLKKIPKRVFEIQLVALTLLKTLSHLSGDSSKLFNQSQNFPFKANRHLYYAIPFLSEIIAGKDLLKWHQEEAKYIVGLKCPKGDYHSVYWLIHLYESTLFRMVMKKKEHASYLEIAEQLFRKVRGNIQDLKTAYEKKDTHHPWLSLESQDLLAFRRLLFQWKMAVDATTVRHGARLPAKFRRPPQKLPLGWFELLQIKKPNKVSMSNAIYPIRGLSSVCREIRTYSSFTLHQVWKERPDFLESFKNIQVKEEVFLNRLQIAYQLKACYPQLPQESSEKLQLEMFLLLIEQGINTLATQHELGTQPESDLQTEFSDFNEQVHIKDQITIAPLSAEPKGSLTSERISPLATEEKKPPPPFETDFPDITDDQELGMGIETMPFVFPFKYEENQKELPLEYIPKIQLDDLHWNGMNARGISLQLAKAKIFVNKLEILPSYRYEIYSASEISKIKFFQKYTCFIVKREMSDKTQYYIGKKEEQKNKHGKSISYIALNLSEPYLRKINEAFFFIYPPPYNQHILAIPR